jgi:hypothetical protein
MSTIHMKQTTTLTPEQYIAGLTDSAPADHSCSPTASTTSSPCTT